MFNLQGKRALVTGATGGIGSAIAQALHAQGAEVVLSGTRIEALQQLQDKLASRVHILSCDLSKKNEVENLVPTIESDIGALDIVVNNAGITRDNLIIRMKDEEWHTVLEVNLEACFRICRAAIKPMMKRRKGRIINITSIVGVTGNPGQVNYCAAKAGIIGLSKSLAQEVASRGITINCIAPGFIDSPMISGLAPAVKEKIMSAIPLGRIGAPEDIAAAVIFLSSAESAYITGQTLHINGGMSMV